MSKSIVKIPPVNSYLCNHQSWMIKEQGTKSLSKNLKKMPFKPISKTYTYIENKSKQTKYALYSFLLMYFLYSGSFGMSQKYLQSLFYVLHFTWSWSNPTQLFANHVKNIFYLYQYASFYSLGSRDFSQLVFYPLEFPVKSYALIKLSLCIATSKITKTCFFHSLFPV